MAKLAIENAYIPKGDGTFSIGSFIIANDKIQEVFNGSCVNTEEYVSKFSATSRIAVPGMTFVGTAIPRPIPSFGKFSKDALRSGFTSFIGIPEEDTIGEPTVLENMYWWAERESLMNYSFCDVHKGIAHSTQQLFKVCDPDKNCGLFIDDSIVKNKKQMDWIIDNIRGYPLLVEEKSFLLNMSSKDNVVIQENGGFLPFFEIQYMLQQGYNNELEHFSQVIRRLDAKKFETSNPFGLLKGKIQAGYDADIVLLAWEKMPYEITSDTISECTSQAKLKYTNFKVEHVWVKGNHVYDRGAFSSVPKNLRMSFNR